MSHLDARQRHALAQFQDLTNASDAAAAAAVLQSTAWDVQRAVDLVFGPRMLPLDIDDRPPPRPRPLTHYILRPLLALVSYPLHIVSSLLRFLFAVLRIPVPHFAFPTLSFSRSLPRSRPRPATRGPDRWLRELEEETGAVSLGVSATGASTAPDSAGPSTLRARRPTEDGVKILPDFALVPYDDMLRICQKDARIGCVVIVSQEHDDVAEFKRSTLTDPAFVQLLNENNIVVWGGDVCDQDTWSASEKLQATTYPFVAFVALQPRRNPLSSTSRSSASTNSSPTLTVLSRHQGPSIGGGPTSSQALCDHLTNQLLPRVSPFLERIHATQRERERDRQLREEQDRAFQDAARRDKERIQNKIAEERREQDRLREEAEEEERKRQREQERKVKEERRMEWRRWVRRAHDDIGEGSNKGIRVAVRFPSGGRAMRAFDDSQTLTALYAFVDAQLVPTKYVRGEDPIEPPPGGAGRTLEEQLEAQIEKDGEGAAWWGFRLALAYPRKEIPWVKGCTLSEVESLRGGGQVVVEMLGNATTGDGEDSDDGYNTEESE